MHAITTYRTRSRIRSMVLALLTVGIAGPGWAEGHEKTDATKQPMQSWKGQARDAWVDGKLEASYALNSYLNPFDIDTHVEHGVVRLSGTVESQIDKDLAEEIARGIDGVEDVRNDLSVQPGSEHRTSDRSRGLGTRVEDATTTARVKAS